MFCNGYEKGLTVNHKDGNKINNLYTNLEWVTYKENSKHAFKIGLAKGHGKKPVRQIDIETGEEIRIFNSIKEAQMFIIGENKRNISTVANGWHETAYGYKWEFVDNE